MKRGGETGRTRASNVRHLSVCSERTTLTRRKLQGVIGKHISRWGMILNGLWWLCSRRRCHREMKETASLPGLTPAWVVPGSRLRKRCIFFWFYQQKIGFSSEDVDFTALKNGISPARMWNQCGFKMRRSFPMAQTWNFQAWTLRKGEDSEVINKNASGVGFRSFFISELQPQKIEQKTSKFEETGEHGIVSQTCAVSASFSDQAWSLSPKLEPNMQHTRKANLGLFDPQKTYLEPQNHPKSSKIYVSLAFSKRRWGIRSVQCCDRQAAYAEIAWIFDPQAEGWLARSKLVAMDQYR